MKSLRRSFYCESWFLPLHRGSPVSAQLLMQTQCSEWASLWLYAQLRDKRHRWAQYLDVPQSPRDLGDLCSHYNLFWSFSSNTASKRLTSVLLAHDSHYSSAACSATTYGQSDNQQDSRTVTVADLHENISKNDKIYILADLNKSFPGTEKKAECHLVLSFWLMQLDKVFL